MSKQMKLGFMIGYWGAGPPLDAPELLAEAEQLGYDSAWTAEAYGSDALTPLAWYGSQTSHIKLGTSICQIAARTPTAMAMAAITLDHLTGGRFILGLGASGPQVVEGWYGQPYPKPLAPDRASTSRSSVRCSPARSRSSSRASTTRCRTRVARDSGSR